MTSPSTQDQFLTVLPRAEAAARFLAALDPRPLGWERVRLDAALGRIAAERIAAPGDVPPFDRAVVDGFAVRAADLADAPRDLRLSGEILACGTAPRLPVTEGVATPIATGAPIPRGADAVIMIEQTEPAGPDQPALIRFARPAAPGQFIAFAGSDMARGETILAAGTVIGARDIAMLAACGIAELPVHRRPKVAVISTGNELIAPGQPLPPAAIHDANGPVICAAVTEAGGEAVFFGAVPDDEAALGAVMRRAHAACDMVILSGGTSKGAGDLTCRLIADLGAPGILAHGVALKPGKPLCLAVCAGKPVVVLPGFPTSAMFTFHDMIAPVLRRLAGLPEPRGGQVSARVPLRVPSELGRTEFVMVALTEDRDGEILAFPVSKGSGAVTAFAQADGFIAIDALSDALPANSRPRVTLFTPDLRLPDLTIIGSHCAGLDLIVAELMAQGLRVRVMTVGSQGGLTAARRGQCDLAPIHLLDAATDSYNAPFLDADMALLPGWRRMQGFACRPDDPRFAACADATQAVARALADPACVMVNRNAGSGTRLLLDRLLDGRRPEGFSNQPRAHNAVAAAIAQGRADWGLCIDQTAAAQGLRFLPLRAEHFDFALPRARADRPAVQAFRAALAANPVTAGLAQLGFIQ